MTNIMRALDRFTDELDSLGFASPVHYVYNPLRYARKPFDMYLKRYGSQPKEVLLLGMNPGPWGMAQTGVPFGEIVAVRDWLGIEEQVGSPDRLHPKRPVDGFSCRRSEASGKRLWGWARETFGTPERFFARFFVVNYCPLLFYDAEGRNLTPDKLKAVERDALCVVCDRFLRETVGFFQPRFAIGVGLFAEQRFRALLSDGLIVIGRVSHPSPANPAANRGWSKLVRKELISIGVALPELA